MRKRQRKERGERWTVRVGEKERMREKEGRTVRKRERD